MQNYNKDKICKRRTTRSRTILIDYKPAVNSRSDVENIYSNSDDQQINTDKIEMNKPSIGIRNRNSNSASVSLNSENGSEVDITDLQKSNECIIKKDNIIGEDDINLKINNVIEKVDKNMVDETTMGDNYKFPSIKEKIKYFERIKQLENIKEIKTASETNEEETLIDKKEKSCAIKISSENKKAKNNKIEDSPKSLEKFMYDSILEIFPKPYNEMLTTKSTEKRASNSFDNNDQDVYKNKFKSVKNIVKMFENSLLQRNLSKKDKKDAVDTNYYENVKQKFDNTIYEKPSKLEFAEDREHNFITCKEKNLSELSQIKDVKISNNANKAINDRIKKETIVIKSNTKKSILDDSHLNKDVMINKTVKDGITDNNIVQNTRSYDFASIFDRWKKITNN